MGQLTVRQLGFALGAEVTGIDLSKPLDDLKRREILDAWHKHLVLVFPGQDLSAEEQIAFSRNFGALEDNESLPYYRDPGHKEILLVTNKQIGGKPSETRNTGRNWHADLTYTTRPAKGSLLLCKEKPAVGGDTMWANLYLAYETLSAPTLAFLNQHATSPEFVYRHRWSVNDLVMWDNRCTLHVALPDFDQTKTRHMTRTSLLGTVTGRVLEEGAAPEKEALMQAIASVS